LDIFVRLTKITVDIIPMAYVGRITYNWRLPGVHYPRIPSKDCAVSMYKILISRYKRRRP
jgi:hypothetical protein